MQLLPLRFPDLPMVGPAQLIPPGLQPFSLHGLSLPAAPVPAHPAGLAPAGAQDAAHLPAPAPEAASADLLVGTLSGLLTAPTPEHPRPPAAQAVAAPKTMASPATLPEAAAPSAVLALTPEAKPTYRSGSVPVAPLEPDLQPAPLATIDTAPPEQSAEQASANDRQAEPHTPAALPQQAPAPLSQEPATALPALPVPTPQQARPQGDEPQTTNARIEPRRIAAAPAAPSPARQALSPEAVAPAEAAPVRPSAPDQTAPPSDVTAEAPVESSDAMTSQALVPKGGSDLRSPARQAPSATPEGPALAHDSAALPAAPVSAVVEVAAKRSETIDPVAPARPPAPQAPPPPIEAAPAPMAVPAVTTDILPQPSAETAPAPAPAPERDLPSPVGRAPGLEPHDRTPPASERAVERRSSRASERVGDAVASPAPPDRSPPLPSASPASALAARGTGPDLQPAAPVTAPAGQPPAPTTAVSPTLPVQGDLRSADPSPPPSASIHLASPRFAEEVAIAIARRPGGLAPGDELVLQIEPADLGRIRVELRFAPDGGLEAVVSADQPRVLEQLRSHSAELHRSLLEAGGRADIAAPRFEARQDGAGLPQQGSQGSSPQYGGSQNGGTGQQHGQPCQQQSRAGFLYPPEPAPPLPSAERPRLTSASGRLDLIA